MILNLESALIEKIQKHYEEWMDSCPVKKKEVDEWVAKADEDEAICMKFLYAYMHPCDIVSYEVDVIAAYVKATLEMYKNIPYAKQVPPEIFFTYVLYVRVNNEDLDQSRKWIYDQLAERVKDKKSMTEAALEVNYWCYEKATYIPSDERTLGPIGMCSSAKGRCGEESTLAVSAMRSVGIPARQCYVPRWAHCDDNHAWVEVWTDGEWHYLGACEPEPVLDKGWFTAAASKAMLVHAKAYSDLESSNEIAYKTPLYALMNVTERYAKCDKLTVKVTNNGKALKDVTVAFSLVNYSELFPLYREKTKEDGTVSFMTGKGDLYVYAVYEGKYLGKKVDMRKEQSVTLEMEKGIIPEKIEDVLKESFELKPPMESMPKAASAQMKHEHERRLSECEEIRAAYEETFVQEEGEKSWSGYYAKARGNHEEIRKFEQMTEFADEDKRLVLDTLRKKDFIDTTANALASYLRASLPYKEKFPLEAYQKYLLSVRAGNEKLTGNREKIAKLVSDKKLFDNSEPLTAKQVWEYVTKRLETVADYGTGNWPAEADGCIKCGIITNASKRVVFVQICRAMGIMARINPVTGKAEAVYADNDVISFEAMEKEETTDEIKTVQIPLTLVNNSDRKMEYFLHMTIAKFEDDVYRTQNYEELSLEPQQKTTLMLTPGAYRVITTQRQIDGAVSCIATSFVMDKERTIELEQAPAQISQKCMCEELSDTTVQPVTAKAEVDGNPLSIKSLYEGKKSVLIFAEPGKEPTEHLFQEILECKEAYKKGGYRLIIGLQNTAALKNETLQRVLASGLNLTTVLCNDDEYLYHLHEVMNVGDERLPYALAVNREGKGLFAFANYNIRTAWTLMEILDAKG